MFGKYYSMMERFCNEKGLIRIIALAAIVYEKQCGMC